MPIYNGECCMFYVLVDFLSGMHVITGKYGRLGQR